MNYTLAIDNIDPSKLFSKGKFVGKIKLVPKDNRTILAKQPNKDSLSRTGNALHNFVQNQEVEQVSKTNERRKDIPYINLPAVKRIAKMPLNLLKLLVDGSSKMDMKSSLNIENNISNKTVEPEVEQPVAEAITPVAVNEEPKFEKYEMPVEEPVAMVSTSVEVEPTPIAAEPEVREMPIEKRQYQEDISIPSEPIVSRVTTKSTNEFPSIVPTDSSMEQVGELARGVTELRRERDEAMKRADNATSMCSTLQGELDTAKDQLKIVQNDNSNLKTELANTIAEMNRILGENNDYRAAATRTQEEKRRLQEALDAKNNESAEIKADRDKVLHLYATLTREIQGVVGPMSNDSKTKTAA